MSLATRAFSRKLRQKRKERDCSAGLKKVSEKDELEVMCWQVVSMETQSKQLNLGNTVQIPKPSAYL